MVKLVVEYLVVIIKSNALCDSIEGFNRLLQVNSSILISPKKGEISFGGDFVCGYLITGGDIAGTDQLYLHLKFVKNLNAETADEEIEQFTRSLKTVRGIISSANGQTETLWDDISFYYSQKAYPIIYEIENLMRKLITNFMTVTVGKDWVALASPNEIQEVINKSKRKDQINVLQTIDFAYLADFLLKPYSNKSLQELYLKIKNATAIDDLNEIRELIPRSNWQRYFSVLVECEDGHLQKKWSQLYDLRCKVAHNALVTYQDFSSIYEIANELKEILIKAISKLPQVTLPSNEKQAVAENVEITLSQRLNEWIDRLPDRERLVYILRNFEGLSNRESAKVLSISEGRSSQLHTQALLRLRGYAQRYSSQFYDIQQDDNELAEAGSE